MYPDFPFTAYQKRWINTLAGKLVWKPRQTVGMLRETAQHTNENNNITHDGFCCLGVACQIAVDMKLTTNDWVLQDMAYEGEQIWVFDESEDILPNSIVNILNLRDNIGCCPVTIKDKAGGGHSFRPVCLSNLNDGGYTFIKIANILRAFPHFYFTNGGHPTVDVYGDDISRLYDIRDKILEC